MREKERAIRSHELLVFTAVLAYLSPVSFPLLVAVDPPGDDRRRLGSERLALELVLVVDGHRAAVPDELGADGPH